MADTSFPTTNAFPEPHAQGYTEQTLDEKEAVATDWNPSWGWAAGAMISTLDDLRIWRPRWPPEHCCSLPRRHSGSRR